MSYRGSVVIIALLICFVADVAISQIGVTDGTPVAFFTDTVIDTEDEVLTLMNGSHWYIPLASMILPGSHFSVVLTDTSGIGYGCCNGMEYVVRYLGGVFVPQSGLKTTVVREMGDGAVLKLADGSLWEVDSYDRYDTAYWYPPYPVVIASDEMYLHNLRKGKRIGVKRVQ